MGDFEVLAPATVEEAVAALGQEGAVPIAGGTDLLIHVRAGTASPRLLVDLSGLGLNAIRAEGDTLTVGAMTTVADLLASEPVRRDLWCVTESAAQFGAVQCRNMATVGGNLCSAVPSADLAPPLLALGAQVRIAGPNGDRVLPLEQFFTGPRTTVLEPDEILVEVLIPIPPLRTGTSFLKIGRRRAMALSIVSVAALVSLGEDGRTVENVRVALGAVAPTPLRASRAEAILRGQAFSEELIDEAASAAAEECMPITDMRGTAEYRRDASRVLVKRALSAAWRRAAGEEDAIQPGGAWVHGQADGNGSGPSAGGAAQRLDGGDTIALRVNGHLAEVQVKPQALLADVLRDQLGLLGTKEGCGTGECGACTVLLDGRPINSCLMLAHRAQDKEITTIEGLGTPEDLHPLQAAFVTYGAVQCGFCAPGMLLSARALLAQKPDPTEEDIRFAIAGNICRCTGYVKIVESIKAAAAVMAGGEGAR